MSQSDYYKQRQHNTEQFMELMKLNMPEFAILAEMMIKCRANPTILFHIIKHMGEIASGTGFGQVHVIIEDGTVRFVRGEHSTKLNESVIWRSLEDFAQGTPAHPQPDKSVPDKSV